MAAREDAEARAAQREREVADLTTQVSFLQEEITALRRKLAESPRQARVLEERLHEVQANLAAVTGQNERLVATLKEARDQIVALKEEVDRLAQPPSGFGVFLEAREDGTVEVFTGGRKLRVNLSPAVDVTSLKRGQEVMLNEALNVVEALGYETVGEIVMLKELLEDGQRALVISHADEERVVRLAESLLDQPIRAGDSLLLEPRSGHVYERIPKSEVEELVLEEVPDISYEEIGGLSRQIEQIRDAIELPYLHADLFREHHLRPPKGVLLYGPPGCGKTLIAKAVANSLAKQVAEKTGQSGKSFFLNIKGPELLNKYVGETERHIRLVFQRAREKASEGTPVIVFFDEMDSIFRTRGSGVSSDVENTIVPQLLSEIDGVEGLENVIVIGASNREDMIDPAILRPGRLDVKIKIERPDAEAAKDIFSKYITTGLPLHADDVTEHSGSREATVGGMIQRVVERMYTESEENRFLEVTYANGDKEVLYFKDFNSGAMIQNIVDRGKKMAIKAFLETGQKGLRIAHLMAACVDEFSENEDLPNTTNPDDWARISGKKGERIVYIRTLVSGKQGTEAGRSIDTVANTGQYL
ncbi:proteasome-associated ATPase [Sphaerisporangium siamense]|uniref:AAA ATPase forming ring-shaped complexes n=1 Tax=Sphaerisporangium siamense TaxID=795645 RepID=A0A7W7DBH7_9ACTN|nr:proteasome ATPase [Sphaerisporangium siamense]MBB4703561.1 proteasome-associated ATPase [Sphaerisporangium siamense]GII82032.1 proteasome-associated ATPase [Sphaerisporangium siamense]